MPAINVRKPILKYTDEELAFVLDVNMKGTFRVLRAAGRVMTARKKGSIILFSSIRSQVVEPRRPHTRGLILATGHEDTPIAAKHDPGDQIGVTTQRDRVGVEVRHIP